MREAKRRSSTIAAMRCATNVCVISRPDGVVRPNRSVPPATDSSDGGVRHAKEITTTCSVRERSMMMPRTKIAPRADNGAVNVIVEIPKGSRNKYEYDLELDVIALDRTLYSAVH